jgi:chromosome segregation ATPase
MGSEAIARKLKLSRNPVRNYLRLNSLQSYSYSSYSRSGSPSGNSPSRTADIDELKRRGGRLIKEVDKAYGQLNETNEQIEELKKECTLNEEEKNEINKKYEATKKELEELKPLYTESKNEVQTKRQQKDEYKRQINEELLGLRQKTDNLASKITTLNETLIHAEEETRKKDETIEELEHALKQDSKKDKKIEEIENATKEVLEPSVTSHVSLSPQIQSIKDTPTLEKRETDHPNGGEDWILIGLRTAAELCKAVFGPYKP